MLPPKVFYHEGRCTVSVASHYYYGWYLHSVSVATLKKRELQA